MEYLFSVRAARTAWHHRDGRFNGGSCFLMACAAPDVPIHSIDFEPQNDELLRQMFKEHGVSPRST